MKKLIILNLILLLILIILPKQVEETKEIEVQENEIIQEEIVEETEQREIVEEISRSSAELRQQKQANDISQNCIDLVKQFEGLYLKAYKLDGESNYTIGYGHSNSSIYEGQIITEKQAEEYLKEDLQKAIKCVNKLNLKLNQNQFDALVSFTFNCGNANLKKLTNNRTLEEVSEHITAYTGSSSENHRKGLLKRRMEEKE